MRGGDLTAFRSGQVSLDPTLHMKREPFGMIALPAIVYNVGQVRTPILRKKSLRVAARHAVLSAVVS
jgi:hypothetical protein